MDLGQWISLIAINMLHSTNKLNIPLFEKQKEKKRSTHAKVCCCSETWEFISTHRAIF